MSRIKKYNALLILLLLGLSLVAMDFMTSYGKLGFSSSVSAAPSSSQYIVQLTAADEDFVNFSSMAGFTKGTSWTIVQHIKLPENTITFGWNWFRGSAWDDKDGDLALQLNTYTESANQITFWIRKDSSWNSLIMTRGENGLTLQNNTWYNVVVVFDLPTTTYQLYVEGDLCDSLILGELDDEFNNNSLFFGGQYCAPGYLKDDLYSECDTAIAHQAWYQRALTTVEIQNYDGTVDNSDEDLFFATEITDSEVLDASGNGRNGMNGNSPEFLLYSANSSDITGFSALFLICCFGATFSILLLRKRRILQ